MANDLTISFAADVSSLQRGMQQASSAVQATTSVLRGGADQINATFGSLSQAYVTGAARKFATVQAMSAQELEIARQNEQSEYDIALNGVREQSSLIKERAQLGQLSRQDELTGLLNFESQREAIEGQHLQFLQSVFQQGFAAFATTQHKFEELGSESAARRVQIERTVTQEIQSDYLRSFEQVGASVSASITGMIAGHMRLRDAARSILTQILQGFIQARIKMIADWASGIAAQAAATQSGEAAMTAAVAAGTAARNGLEASAAATSATMTIGAVLKSIAASAGEAFAGVFGFLAPIMGPAASGPATSAEATVLSTGTGLASFANGAWELPANMIAQVHQGEMIIPSGPAAQFRGMMAGNSRNPGAVHVHHAINFSVSAMDSRSVRQFFNDHGRTIMRAINESVRTGSHIGLSRLGSA